VGEHDAADHVADAPYTKRARTQVIVDDYTTSLELYSGRFGAEAFGVRRPAHREQHLVGIHRAAALAAGREANLQRASGFRDLSDLAAGVDLRAKAGEVLHVGVDDVRLDHGEDLREHLEHGDLAAQGREHGRELHADHAAADDGEARGHLLQLEDGVGVDGELGAFERDARNGRAGGDDDVLGLQTLTGDVDRPVAHQLPGPTDDGHAAGFEKSLNAFDELVDHRAFPLLRRGPVEGDVVGDDAEWGAALGKRVQLRRLEQGLGGNAATDQAGAAQPVLLDDGCVRPELRGAERCHVSARSATHHHDVERSRHIAPIYSPYQT